MEGTPSEASFESQQRLCEGCWLLLHHDPVSSPPSRTPTSRTTFGEMSARANCPWCQHLADVLRRYFDALNYCDTESRDRIRLSIYKKPETLCVYFQLLEDSPFDMFVFWLRPPQTTHNRISPAGTDRGKSVSPDTIKQWINDCQNPQSSNIMEPESHSYCQSNSTIKPEALGITLIDVRDRRLVPGDTSQRYLTLSYVWGRDHSFLQAKTHNVSKLHENQALTRAAGVPTLIDDAIDFTKSIGEQYLWVDSLCLVQDASDMKYAGINVMHMIYARAYMTIVAASAKNVFSPLSGFRRDTRAPLASQEIEGRTLTRTREKFHQGLTRSLYYTRGWTMQEFIMSPRCLVFAYDQVYYRCSSALQSEIEGTFSSWYRPVTGFFKLYKDFEGVRDQIRHEMGTLPPRRSPCSQRYTEMFPDFCVYTDLVSSYTERELSYQSDILNAFHAMQSALGSQMNTTFEFGLPMAAISMALLWIPKGKTRGRRRIEEVSSYHNVAHPFPSWSWIGWQEPVRWPPPFCLPTYVHTMVSFEFEEVVAISDCRRCGTKPPTSNVRQLSGTGPELYLASGSLCFDAETVSTRCFHYFQGYCRPSLNYLEILVQKDNAGVHTTDSNIPQANQTAFPGSLDNEASPGSSKSATLRRGRMYGLSIEELQTDDSLELAAMSSFQQSSRLEGCSDDPTYDFSGAHGGGLRDLPVLNCLVIKWHGDYAERVGVAQVSCLAWRDAGPTVKSITLR